MESATFASLAAIILGGSMWVWMSKYFYSNDEVDNEHLFNYTFHVETLRFRGFIAFCIVMLVGTVITDHSGFDTIPDPTETVIFSIFGMNHSCNVIDHNPSKMIAAILVTPLVQLPLMFYCLLWHVRLAKAFRAGKVSKWLLDTSRILTPFNFITMAELHLWFVNGPAETYGFTAHYIPYLMFQLALIFMMLLNILYLDAMGTLPFGIKSWMAWTYVIAYIVLTIICATFVITTLIFNGDGWFRDLVIDYLSPVWVICALGGTVLFSYVESQDGNLLTLSVSDSGVSIASADGRGGYGAV